MRSYDCDSHTITYEDITDGEQVITISATLWWPLMVRWMTALVKAYNDWGEATARYNAIIAGGGSVSGHTLPSGQVPATPSQLITSAEPVLEYLDSICTAVETKEEAAERVAERLATLNKAKQWVRNLGDVRAISPAKQPWYGVTVDSVQYAIGIRADGSILIQTVDQTRPALD